MTLLALVAAVLYVASGVYFVEPDQRAVVRWFGRVPDDQQRPPYGVGPGLHYALPRPFCRVARPKTTEVRRVVVGLPPAQRDAIARGEMWAMQASPASDVFSGDVNILKVTMVVQYQVANPINYLFGTESPDQLVMATVQAVLIEEMARFPVDQLLTSAKAQLEETTRLRAHQLLEEYRCGVWLVATNLESIEPPQAIIGAFKDVVSAKKDGEKLIDRAVAEANRILPQARGAARRLEEEAKAYAHGRISQARGATDAFLALLAEYQAAPRVTAERLLLQTLERVLPRVRKVIVDNKPDEQPTNIRIVEDAPR